MNLIDLGLIGEKDLIFDQKSKSFKRFGESREKEKDDLKYFKPKKEEKQKKRKINVEELILEVNKFDKEFDINLKNSTYSSEEFYKILLNKSDFVLSSLIGYLNGIDVGTYTKATFENKTFADISSLDWNNTKSYKDESLMFKCRFLTLLLSKFLGNLKKIVKRLTRNYDQVTRLDKSIMLVAKIMNNLLLFVNLVLDNKNYKNVFIKVNEYASYLDKDVNHSDLIQLTYKIIMNIREGLDTDLSDNRFCEDDMLIDDIMKLAYITTTYDSCLKNLPKWKHIKGATLDYDLSGIIVAYGKEILKYRGNLSPVFQCYLEAHSQIMSDIYVRPEDDDAFLIGCYALGFTRFLLDTENASAFINEMLRSGI